MLAIPSQDLLLTLAAPVQAETRVRGSRFLALAAPAPGRPECDSLLLAEQKKYFDATHHCWAWRSLEAPAEDWAASDAGEPSGTAGQPILGAIDSAGLCGVALVVTRWFGGTKLGTGGLARAYAGAAREALAIAPRRSGMRAEEFSLEFDYALTGIITHLAEACPAMVTARRFQQRVGLDIAVASSRAEAFLRELAEATAGRVELLRLGPRPVFP